jgi:hypothetical protein
VSFEKGNSRLPGSSLTCLNPAMLDYRETKGRTKTCYELLPKIPNEALERRDR